MRGFKLYVSTSLVNIISGENITISSSFRDLYFKLKIHYDAGHARSRVFKYKPTNKSLAVDLGVSESYIKRYLSLLVKVGLVTVSTHKKVRFIEVHDSPNNDWLWSNPERDKFNKENAKEVIPTHIEKAPSWLKKKRGGKVKFTIVEELPDVKTTD